jgi:hypothetical protein
VTHAATGTGPSLWVIPEDDQIIDPDLQAAMAARINATLTRMR